MKEKAKNGKGHARNWNRVLENGIQYLGLLKGNKNIRTLAPKIDSWKNIKCLCEDKIKTIIVEIAKNTKAFKVDFIF